MNFVHGFLFLVCNRCDLVSHNADRLHSWLHQVLGRGGGVHRCSAAGEAFLNVLIFLFDLMAHTLDMALLPFHELPRALKI